MIYFTHLTKNENHVIRKTVCDFASEEFKKQVKIQRETFDIILNIVEPYLTKKETNLNQYPISVNKQLGLTLY